MALRRSLKVLADPGKRTLSIRRTLGDVGSGDGPVVLDGDDPATSMILYDAVDPYDAPIIQDEVDPVIVGAVATICDGRQDRVGLGIQCEDVLMIPTPLMLPREVNGTILYVVED